MKNIILKLGIISIVFFNSCINEDLSNIETPKVNILDKNYIQNASMKEKLAYKKYYLKEALKEVRELGFSSNELIALSKNSTYQKDVVLFSDIVSNARSKKRISIKDDKKIEKISNAFKELEGDNYDISFYIPFADNVNQSSKAVASDIYIFEQEDNSEQLAFKGEVLNEDGEFVTYEQLITEEMAEEFALEGRKVVIVGLADVEVIDTGGNQSDPLAGFEGYYNMNAMVVKSHKESWISGASDLTVVAERPLNGYFYNAVSLHSGGEGWDYLFRRVRRKEVRNETYLNINSTILNIDRYPMPPLGKGDFVVNYIIFEADMWPIGNRTITFVNDGVSHNIKYRSSDSQYDYRTIIRKNGITQLNYYVDNQDIRYWASLSNDYK